MRRKKQFKNDLKAILDVAGIESSNYESSTALHIPYGPGWHAKRVDTLIYKTVRIEFYLLCRTRF